MGLDTYAYNDKGMMDDKLFEGADHLCGGMFSGGGASFRGKVYNGFIEDITGVTLYQEKMSASDLDKIISGLGFFIEDFNTEEYAESKLCIHRMTLKEVKVLLAWFKTVKNNNGFVVGWW